MKTDSLFYRIFHTAPTLFFELIGQPDRQGYTFQSVEIKQTAHRIDGIFRPPAHRPQDPVFFSECQFQTDHYLYHRLFAEVFLFLEQNPEVIDWYAIVLYPSRKLEPRHTQAHRALLDSPHVQRIYLNELGPPTAQPLSTGLMQLLVLPKRQTPRLAQQLIRQAESIPTFPPEMILELIITIMVYKFPDLSQEEIHQMLKIATSAQQTRYYQEAREAGLREGRQEGRQEGRREGETLLVIRQLTRRFGKLSARVTQQINQLSLEQLESLAEALLDFETIADLKSWLKRNRDHNQPRS